MRKLITLKNILILSILLSSIFITNCTSDTNVSGYTVSENHSIAKVNIAEFTSVELSKVEYEIEIQVSPNVLNFANFGEVVTIHTDIPFSDVTASTVTLNGIAIQSWKADSRGFFVAKFNIEVVKDLPDLAIGDDNTLTLKGSTADGTFSGLEDILVINKTGRY